MIRQPSDKVQRSGWCLALGRNRASAEASKQEEKTIHNQGG